MISSLFYLSILALHLVQPTCALDPRVKLAFTIDRPSQGFSITPDEKRIFLQLANFDDSTGPGLVERQANGSLTAYPNEAWNSWTEGDNPTTAFVSVAAQRIGPDGQLWVIDNGYGSDGVIPEGAKVVTFNLTTNQRTRTYPFGNLTHTASLLDDIRFNGNEAYLTDAGVGSLIALDLVTGHGRRLLQHVPATVGYMPTSGEGYLMRNSTNGFNFIHADQLEVSPDGKWLHFQTTAGGMSRIATKYLHNALHNDSITDADLALKVKPFAATSCTGSTATDSEGVMYASDTNHLNIMKIFPNGTMNTFIHDPSLVWVDGMWLDGQKRLWLPAAQFNRAPEWHNGTNEIRKPIHIYTIDVENGPAAIDHA
ncbi:major royal jelly protein [Penicillium herquei]|nr:major royal jelly protein [Penicillium herquei]